VGERVAETVRVKVLYPGQLAAQLHPIPCTIRGYGAALGEEQGVEVRPTMVGPHPHIAV
jgi:hypothetical protein